MRGRLYRVLCFFSGLFGAWFFAVVSRIISVGYLIFSGRAPESHRFYRALFPEKGPCYHWWCTFRQYQQFTTIHYDRFLMNHAGQEPLFTSTGWDKLAKVLGEQGGILLMSHLGNWEMAAHLLHDQNDQLPMLLFMGIKEKEGVERLQKDRLRQAGVKIIGVDQQEVSPLGIIEGVKVLRSGGLVSLSGDIVWQKEQRQVEVSFLDRKAYLPAAPYIFAHLSGVPLFAFFSFRSGRNRYDFSLSDPIVVPPSCRSERDKMINRAAQQYADLLVEALRQHPLEWYHFDRFLH